MSKWWRIPRLGLFLFGIFTYFWYFWSWIGLVIGLIYFIIFKDRAWKRNGLMLSFAICFITLFVYFYKDFSPLQLAIRTGLIIFLSYFFILVGIELLKKRVSIIGNLKEKYFQKIQRYPSKVRFGFKQTVILIPIILWSSVSIDIGVMFENKAKLLWIHAPSKINTGELFEVTVEAWDQFERLSATYNGRVEFSLESYNLSNYTPIINPQVTLPEPYTFSGQIFGSDIAYQIEDGKDNGLHVFGMKINISGIHYVLVNDSLTRNTYYSNPILVNNYSVSESMIAWGDIHTHSHLSDGTGTAKESFYFARYVACLDYNALTDHGEIMLFSPGSLNRLESATNNAYEPGEFVTIHGIEWTNVRTGHYVCIFSGNTLLKKPVLSYMTVPTTDALWEALDDFTSATGSRALALPHHTTKKSYIQDWTYINPKYVKLAEVCSVHGDFLFEQRHELNYRGAIHAPPKYTNGSSIIDAYTMGKRMTLYAASDEHDGHPGHSLSHTRAYVGHQRPFSLWHTRNEHPYPGGLTAIYVNNLTREGVFTGLENQRIFANSDHGRPILMFKINETSVGDGSTLTVNNQNSHREINIFIAQDGAPVALKSKAASVTPNWMPNWDVSIEIIKNGRLWNTISVSSPIQNINIIDTEPITGTSYEPYCINIKGDWYINSYSDNPINPSSLTTGGFDYYLVRVVGANGRHSYIGPIWVEY